MVQAAQARNTVVPIIRTARQEPTVKGSIVSCVFILFRRSLKKRCVSSGWSPSASVVKSIPMSSSSLIATAERWQTLPDRLCTPLCQRVRTPFAPLQFHFNPLGLRLCAQFDAITRNENRLKLLRGSSRSFCFHTILARGIHLPIPNDNRRHATEDATIGLARRLSRHCHVPYDGRGAPSLPRGRCAAGKRFLEIPLPSSVACRMDRVLVARSDS